VKRHIVVTTHLLRLLISDNKRTFTNEE